MFSIIIPSWNNLPYLKLCVESIRKYSQFTHEILVHINDGSDGSLEWVKTQGIRYAHSADNVGVCLSVNHLAAQASHEWILFMNDDMVASPGWDTAFFDAIQSVDTDLALFFGTLIEPGKGSIHVINQNFGRSPEEFDESRFLRDYMIKPCGDREGVASQPTLFPKKWWNMVGGYSVEFSPGMSSDDDLIMKFCVIGCRVIRAVGASRFYHFSQKSTTRIKHNHGGRIFVMKWGMTHLEFHRLYLPHLKQKRENIALSSSRPRGTWLGRLRRLVYLWRDYPLEDLEMWNIQPDESEWTQGN